MQKLILNFGEDQDKKNIYNLIVKAIDLSPQEFERIQNYLLNNGFDVYAYPPDIIEARFQHEYLMVVRTIEELEVNRNGCGGIMKILEFIE